MDEVTGRFRVYRVVDAVPHLNLLDVESDTLYTVYQSGYDDQTAIDQLRTGDLIDATLSGDPEADDEPWRIETYEQSGGVTMDFATGVSMPTVADDLWEDGQRQPSIGVLGDDNPAGVCVVQPRDPLPRGAFVPNVLTGLLPLEAVLSSMPEVGAPAVEALFLDSAAPTDESYAVPYGAVLLFGENGREMADRFREAYDLPRGEDSRPAFDPYGL